MKTHEMAFGMGFFWFVLLPSPLHSFKSLVTSSLYLEQQASDKSETHLVTADISYPGK